jgi:steroid delta-isomerase-like uncharacterized protein
MERSPSSIAAFLGPTKGETVSAEENKAIVRRLYEEGNNERNLDVLGEIIAADVISHTPFPESKTGLEGFEEVFTEVHVSFPDYKIEVDDQIAEGDKVVTRYTASGTHEGDFMGISATGKRIQVRGIDIDRLEDGKIVEHWSEASMLGVAEQLGVIGPR